MIELGQIAKEAADKRLKEIISELEIRTQVFCNGHSGRVEIGYLFETGAGSAEKDGLLKTRVVGRSNKVIVLYLGEYENQHLCARLPISTWYESFSLIHHTEPPTKMEEHIPALEELLKSFDFVVPFNEDRYIFSPHPDFTQEKIYPLIREAIERTIANEARRGFPAPWINSEIEDTLYYTLSADLTENGKFTLHQMGELYTTTFGEDMICNRDYVPFGTYHIAKYHKSVADIAGRLKGGVQRIKELTALHHQMCSAIDAALIRGDYEVDYLDSVMHGIMFHSIKSMFSMRICDATGESDLVLHDPRNVLLKPTK